MIAVLIYHRIVPRSKPLRPEDKEERGCIVYDDEFVDHLRALKAAGYETISPEDFRAYHAGDRELPDRSVMITFDDGWRTVHEFALPALRDAKMTATVFVNTGFENANFKSGAPVDEAMTPEMIRELADAGITIGSHGVTHTYFTQLDDAALADELAASKRDLEAIVGRAVTSLAAPGGQADERVVRMAGEAGYTTFFAGGSGTIDRSSNLMSLPRLGVERDVPGARLVANLRPAAVLQHRVIRLIKQLPTKILGPVASNKLRRWLVRSGLGWAISVRFLRRAMTVGTIAVVALLAWILLR